MRRGVEGWRGESASPSCIMRERVATAEYTVEFFPRAAASAGASTRRRCASKRSRFPSRSRYSPPHTRCKGYIQHAMQKKKYSPGSSRPALDVRLHHAPLRQLASARGGRRGRGARRRGTRRSRSPVLDARLGVKLGVLLARVDVEAALHLRLHPFMAQVSLGFRSSCRQGGIVRAHIHWDGRHAV